jgi:hypothetical protein
MKVLPYKRSLFAYPGGTPGFDLSHLALAGATNAFSASAYDGQFINLRSGVASVTGAGTPTYVIDVNGPAVNLTTTGTWLRFTGYATTADQNTTFACIVFPTATIAAGAWVSLGITGAEESSIGCNTAPNLGSDNNGTGRDSGIAIAANTPWFVACSCNIASGNVNFVAVNLRTGQTTTSSASHAMTAAANTGTVGIGSAVFGTSVTGHISTAMYSNNYLSIPQLIQWGADPWSFWYPNKFDLAKMLSTPQPTNILFAQIMM